jgi:hypothetical protein
MKLIYSFLALTLLTACGGGGGSSSDSDSLGLADIAGIYAVNFEDDPDDEYYAVIGSDGRYIEYDFQGDSFDLGDNCYIVYRYFAEELGNNSFAVTDLVNDFKLRLRSVSGGFKSTVFEVNGESVNFESVIQRTSLLESDFSPEC